MKLLHISVILALLVFSLSFVAAEEYVLVNKEIKGGFYDYTCSSNNVLTGVEYRDRPDNYVNALLCTEITFNMAGSEFIETKLDGVKGINKFSCSDGVVVGVNFHDKGSDGGDNYVNGIYCGRTNLDFTNGEFISVDNDVEKGFYNYSCPDNKVVTAVDFWDQGGDGDDRITGIYCSSYKESEDNETITCSADIDCGSTIVSDPFCSASDIVKETTTFKCNNPGTSQSFCSNSTDTDVVESCSLGCTDGQCSSTLTCVKAKEQGLISVNSILEGTSVEAILTNNAVLPFNFSIAVYNMFDNSIDNQTLFDSQTLLFNAGERKTLTADLPDCKYQVDIVCDSEVFENLSGIRYGERFIAGRTSNSTEFCERPAPSPVCGNDVLEGTEQCDDGNTANGDGCSSTCQNEQPVMSCIEAKNAGLITVHSFLNGNVTVSNNATSSFKLSFASYNMFDNSIDNQTLFDSETLLFNPGDKKTLSIGLPDCKYQLDLICGELVYNNLSGIRYGERFIAGRTSNSTEFCAMPTAPVCGNGIIETTEICDDGNLINDDGCSSLCRLETNDGSDGGSDDGNGDDNGNGDDDDSDEDDDTPIRLRYGNSSADFYGELPFNLSSRDITRLNNVNDNYTPSGNSWGALPLIILLALIVITVILIIVLLARN